MAKARYLAWLIPRASLSSCNRWRFLKLDKAEEFMVGLSTVSRRGILGAAATLAAAPALAAECRLGPPPHEKGPLVFMNYDQVELDAAYDQSSYESNIGQISARGASNSDAVRARIGEPQRVAYGPTAIEKLDIYRAKQAPTGKKAPIFVFIHGGTWRTGTSRDSAAPAELFHDHGVHYIALDFINVLDAGGGRWPIRCGARSPGSPRMPPASTAIRIAF